MRDFLEKKWIEWKWKAGEFVSQIKEEERGDTNFVSIIIIIVIVLGIAAVFRKELGSAVENVMGQLDTFIGGGE